MPSRSDIYRVVSRIARGRVATYGQVAELAGYGPHARQVGYALAALQDERVPWHRVINAKGEISNTKNADLQRDLLESEGVQFDDGGRVELSHYRWQP